MVANYDVVLKWMLRFDRNGQPVKEIDRVGLAERSVYYNSVDPTKRVYGSPGEIEVDHIDFVNGVIQVSGNVFRVTLPHEGTIFAQSGKVLIDLATHAVLFQAGQTQYIDGDVAALCEHLK